MITSKGGGIDLLRSKSRLPIAELVMTTLAMTLAMAGGALVSEFPLILGLVGGIAILTVVLSSGAKATEYYLILFALVVVGYVVQGRGFAYLGFEPVFIGEAILALGLLMVILRVRRAYVTFPGLLLFAFIVFGFIRTIPGVREFGMVAIRDAAIWYYALFAMIIGLVLTRTRLEWFLRLFANLIPVILVWYLVMVTVIPVYQERLPSLPGSPLPILSTMKPGDRAVVLVAIAVFLSTGLYRKSATFLRSPSVVVWLLWVPSAAIAAFESRGAMLGLALALLFAYVLRPSLGWVRPLLIGAIAFAVFAVVNPTIPTGTHREISMDQLTANIQSIYSDTSSNVGSVDGTKSWRLEWWMEVINDTVGGSLTWQGWGFGPNLSVEYGFGEEGEFALRSPHNSHLTILARMGLPGAIVWTTFNVVLFFSLLSRARVKEDSGEIEASVSQWVLSIWVAASIVATFDVYLEGPQGAIPYWGCVGVGLYLLATKAKSSEERTNVLPSGIEPRQFNNTLFPPAALVR